MEGKKKLSGWQNKLKRVKKQSEFRKKQKTLDSFINTTNSDDNADTCHEETEEYTLIENENIDASESSGNDITNSNIVDVQGTSNSPHENTASDLNEISDWPASLSTPMIEKIVLKGPVNIDVTSYPEDSERRSFSKIHFSKKTANGECIKRSWLVYSSKANRIFCFCCKLFSDSESALVNAGSYDWRHTTQILKRHEYSNDHYDSFGKWIELKKRIENAQTVDCLSTKQYLLEVQHWNAVLKRIISIILMMTSENMAFRGSSDKVFTENNGKFLKIVELLGQFDLVMEKHLKRASENPHKAHYLGKSIQEEIILMIAKTTQNKILDMIQNALYYSIIVDCTPDISHKEQMSVIIRYVVIQKQTECSAVKVEIRESFIEFLNIFDSTGAGMKGEILKFLNSHNLSIVNLRGQGYDNGANMKGRINGVQRHILNVNPRAFFIPCVCHSLNLVVVDAVKSSLDIVNFFSVIQLIHNFLSASTKRWNIFESNFSKFTVKSLSDTRWESHINAVRAIKLGLKEIYMSLKEIASVENNSVTKLTAESIASKLDNFDFICGIVIWHDVLSEINCTSKILQSKTSDVKVASSALKGTLDYLVSCNNEDSYKKYILEAKDLASDAELSNEFLAESNDRIRKRKRFFDEEMAITEPEIHPKIKFKKNFYDMLFSIAIKSVKERFENFSATLEPFEFLYNVKNIKEMQDNILKEKCVALDKSLSHGELKDIHSEELQFELKLLFRKIEKQMSPEAVLKYIYDNEIEELFPNTCIAYRILLTLPVTVCSAERSFSKLKLIKNYLRSTLSQEKLNGLAIISIENETAQSLDIEKLRLEFARMKARKAPFSK